MLSVLMTSPEKVLFEGMAESVIVPGEQGTFEVLSLHRPVSSRILKGLVTIDGKSFSVRRGVIAVADDEVAIVVEPQQAKRK